MRGRFSSVYPQEMHRDELSVSGYPDRPRQRIKDLNSTIAIFNLVQDDLKQVEDIMRAEPQLLAARSFVAEEDAGRNATALDLKSVIDYLVSSGGKRLRPALALLVGHIYPTKLEKIANLAAAIEMLHTATLVHDDLIDGALLRRGNPTLNATWTPSATVLTGDFLFARAADLAAQTNDVRVLRLFAQTLMVICSGEINQMFDRHANLSREQYYKRIYAKTAALFAVATEAASVLGRASEPATSALRDFGEHLGMAFQIVDDVLDFVGDEERMGKPVGSDLRAGLVTSPTLWFLEQYASHDLINDILNNGRKDDASIQTAVHSIRESGAIEASLDEARCFVQGSQTALEILPPSVFRDALWELSDFVVERNR
jgi:geranylgeranyl pyrophosphate synthase